MEKFIDEYLEERIDGKEAEMLYVDYSRRIAKTDLLFKQTVLKIKNLKYTAKNRDKRDEIRKQKGKYLDSLQALVKKSSDLSDKSQALIPILLKSMGSEKANAFVKKNVDIGRKELGL